jgi:threonine dehydrogenase-like Zn-dependent dehydrogenase
MAKRLIHYSNKLSALEEFDLKPLENDEVLVQSIASGISLGTERKVALGQIPVKVNQIMRVPYMVGEFNFPLGYGYSLIGEVIEGDKKWLNKKVHVMHPHQDICRVKKKDLIEIPSELNEAKASLISNMETALNAYWDGRIKQSDRILIIGFGLIGALLSGVIKIKTQNQIQVLEKDIERRKIAESLGIDTVEKAEESNYNIVYNTAGNSDSIETAFHALKQEGSLVELSWYGDKKVCIDLGSDFHIKRLKIISSQVSHVPERKKRTWDFKRRKKAVIKLLQNPWFENLPLEAIPFNDSAQFFIKMRENKTPALSYYFKY